MCVATGLFQAGVLVFAPRVTEQTIRVPLIDDTTWEANETFLIKLANPRHADTVRTHSIPHSLTICASLSLSLSLSLPPPPSLSPLDTGG